MRTVLVTGGAGFAGSTLALGWKRDFPEDRIIVLDNLVRAGSEHSLPRLAAAGIEFVRGDVRQRTDLEAIGKTNGREGDLDLILDCSAEPSVQAGYHGENRTLIDTNFIGTLNCLDLARARGARVILLSTSRVYPIPALRNLPLHENTSRLFIPENARGTGWSPQGITTDFPLNAHRSLYGATKLASEIFIEEYAAAYNLEAIVNRLGVLAGPWQMGKVDQGFMALWAAQFLYGGRLSYHGFGGNGKQVRDVLHVEDLYSLIKIQATDFPKYSGRVYNAGGGLQNSVSLLELSALCQKITGHKLTITSNPETHPSDVPWYVTDNSRITAATGWSPVKGIEAILEDTVRWLTDHRKVLEGLLRRP